MRTAPSYESCIDVISFCTSTCVGSEALKYDPVLAMWHAVSYFTKMCRGSEAGSYLRLRASCITQHNLHCGWFLKQNQLHVHFARLLDQNHVYAI